MYNCVCNSESIGVCWEVCKLSLGRKERKTNTIRNYFL